MTNSSSKALWFASTSVFFSTALCLWLVTMSFIADIPNLIFVASVALAIGGWIGFLTTRRLAVGRHIFDSWADVVGAISVCALIMGTFGSLIFFMPV